MKRINASNSPESYRDTVDVNRTSEGSARHHFSIRPSSASAIVSLSSRPLMHVLIVMSTIMLCLYLSSEIAGLGFPLVVLRVLGGICQYEDRGSCPDHCCPGGSDICISTNDKESCRPRTTIRGLDKTCTSSSSGHPPSPNWSRAAESASCGGVYERGVPPQVKELWAALDPISDRQDFCPEFRDSPSCQDVVERFGIDLSRVKLSKSGNWMTFNATASEAESLLRTQYHLYSHSSGSRHVACEHYSIPAHLSQHIDIITPTVHFDENMVTKRGQRLGEYETALKKLKKRQLLGGPNDASNPKIGAAVEDALMTLDNCDTMITPKCLQALYNIPDGTLAGKK